MCIIKPYPPRSGSGPRGGFIAPNPGAVVTAAAAATSGLHENRSLTTSIANLNLNGSPRLDQRLSAWRAALVTRNLVALIYLDSRFGTPTPGDPFVGSERIITTFEDPSVNANPKEQVVVIQGSYVDPADHDPDHPTGRYLVRGDFSSVGGPSDATVWVSQWVASHRFLEAHIK